MEYNSCPLYELKSKKLLCYLLGIKDNRLLKQSYVASLIEPYIDTTGKPRLIEPPRAELKIVQKRIKNLLGRITVPENVFSGIKGRSYADNAAFHIGSNPRYLFKIDLTAFFPSISREFVYSFFLSDLKCSPDIANILTNFTTIDLSKATLRTPQTVYDFLSDKNVTCLNHLISGAPTSQILSYLVNHKLFDEMQQLSDKLSTTMTVYVDDVTFSSEQKITRGFKEKIFHIIKKHSYQISKGKVKSYTKKYPKLVTGVIIDTNGELSVKNSLQKKIIIEHNYLRDHPDDVKSRQRLKGLVTAARQVKRDVFPTIHNYAFEKYKSDTQVYVQYDRSVDEGDGDMQHESFDKVLKISDTDITFEQIYGKDYIPAEYLDDIKKANLLIIPNESFRDEGDILFPETTRDFLDFIRESSGGEIVADIAASDENFQQIELHSAVIDIASIIVQFIIFPVAANIIADFLGDLVKKYRRKPDETSAKIKIIAEETRGKKTR